LVTVPVFPRFPRFPLFSGYCPRFPSEYQDRATIWHTGVPGLGLIAAAVALLQSSFSLGA
jgi:hypothetical protein